MHDHWSLSKVILLKRTFSFLENTQKKKKGGDHGVHQRYIIGKRQSFKTWKSFGMEINDCITIVGINKSSEQMIYYDSYQVLKLCEKF